MKLVSTTLAGPGTEGIIGDALRSVAGLVRWRLVIETAGTIDALRPSDTDVIVQWPWCDDFAAARNAALDLCEDLRCSGRARDGGPDWAVMLDTDERVICPDPAAVRAFLAALPPEVEVVVAHAADGSHSRERFFRLPARHRWIGRTHEAFPVERGQQATIPANLIAWSELPKTPEQLRAKNERDVAMLEAEVAEHPDDPRWRFYLGAALAGCGRHEEAIEAYRAAADRGRGEDCALACVRAAEILIAEKRYEEAVAACARGMTIRPDIAELPWLAAGACINAGDPYAAEAWARLAEVHGERGTGRDALERRVSFRNTRALREGPAEILTLARRAMGKDRPVHITVTSTAVNAELWAGRCVRSVVEQTFKRLDHVYFAGDADTYEEADGGGDERLRAHLSATRPFPPLLANLLPVWRSLPDDEVIVWLDGDDWLAHEHALEIVAEAHRRGALCTYGSFILHDGTPGFAAPVGSNPRAEPWRATHLKTFRAGLVKRIRESDLRREDGAYLDLGIDQAIMLACVEMAGERAVYIPNVLAVYNRAHSFEANASEAEKAREWAEVTRIRGFERYRPIAWP